MHALGKKLLFEWYFTHGMKVQRLEVWVPKVRQPKCTEILAMFKTSGNLYAFDRKGYEDRSEEQQKHVAQQWDTC